MLLHYLGNLVHLWCRCARQWNEYLLVKFFRNIVASLKGDNYMILTTVIQFNSLQQIWCGRTTVNYILLFVENALHPVLTIYFQCKTLFIDNYIVSQKTSHLWLAITLTHMNGFWYFFGRNVTDKVGNLKTFYYATSSNLCFCTTWQNAETRKSHISLNWIVLRTQCTCAQSSWKKKCHLRCVW